MENSKQLLTICWVGCLLFCHPMQCNAMLFYAGSQRPAVVAAVCINTFKWPESNMLRIRNVGPKQHPLCSVFLCYVLCAVVAALPCIFLSCSTLIMVFGQLARPQAWWFCEPFPVPLVLQEKYVGTPRFNEVAFEMAGMAGGSVRKFGITCRL